MTANLIKEIEEFLDIKHKVDNGMKKNTGNILCPYCYRFYVHVLDKCNHCLKSNPYK